MARDPKVGRNDRCPCGSGKKYKNCCARKARAMSVGNWAVVAAVVAAAAALVLILLNPPKGGTIGSPACPPGQVWSPEHNHCH